MSGVHDHPGGLRVTEGEALLELRSLAAVFVVPCESGEWREANPEKTAAYAESRRAVRRRYARRAERARDKC